MAYVVLYLLSVDVLSTRDVVCMKDSVLIVWWALPLVLVYDGFVCFVGLFVFVYLLAVSCTLHTASVVSMELSTTSITIACASTTILLVDDVIVFYTLFEVLLIAMYWYLVRHIQHARGMYAVLLLVIYTVIGSTLLLLGMVTQYIMIGSTSSIACTELTGCSSKEYVYTVLLHIAFSTKIPCYPVHAWLVDAHVESTTEASILLAGIYLKIGICGWWRYLLSTSTTAVRILLPYTICMLVLATLSVSVHSISTADIKRFAACSSILHMQCSVTCMMLSKDAILLHAAMIMIAMHTLIASYLFYVCGTMYVSHGIRVASQIGVYGTASWVLLYLMLSNASYPCTASYYAEVYMIGTAILYAPLVSMCVLVSGGVLAVVGVVLWSTCSMGRVQYLGCHSSSTILVHVPLLIYSILCSDAKQCVYLLV
uniref:NADH-ubiquinone oxidoreductase chain 4 n=1 Tax=Rhynchopus euleeides TaxID=630703 RepID=A0A2D2AJW3_9EUGL|nr:NADH dehydrogenase subunit 4 [Rhynchopus euleeides]